MKLETYDVVEEAKRGVKRTKRWVKRHPWESVGIAAAIGAALGALFRR